MLLIDVDHFKRFNDRYGHPVGDGCLRQVAAVIATCARRAGDLAARYGGEEFALLLPHAGPADALALAHRCVDALAALAIPHADSPVAPHVTVSIGVASRICTPGGDTDPLVLAADAALYRAKHAGRARVELAE